MAKRLALVNYYNPNFWDFANRLESDGFKVFWINSRPMSSQWLRSRGVLDSRICEVLDRDIDITDESEGLNILWEFEQPHLPTINSIILMDRVLRHAPYRDALMYLAHSAGRIKTFLIKNDIKLVSSGRDTALQLLTMLICKKLGIFWGCVTRTKLPTGRFGFTTTHEGAEFYQIREPSENDYVVARRWLESYRCDEKIKPMALKKIENYGRCYTLLKK